jgi:hypothetical protein
VADDTREAPCTAMEHREVAAMQSSITGSSLLIVGPHDVSISLVVTVGVHRLPSAGSKKRKGVRARSQRAAAANG